MIIFYENANKKLTKCSCTSYILLFLTKEHDGCKVNYE